ncbi:hypothetical protein RESH_03856 [Rhodopirellula europaea SH398]|jgi:hypothetical protein|uniref:Uncharacterized protein n=1 Tax=Rhodopirellula europaea SH398 TaxID=1263868 RepID=M5S1S7_9BACT|nr:hypothetical protein RESH_03856 [Rhodopirellula europaea SH398]
MSFGGCIGHAAGQGFGALSIERIDPRETDSASKLKRGSSLNNKLTRETAVTRKHYLPLPREEKRILSGEKNRTTTAMDQIPVLPLGTVRSAKTSPSRSSMPDCSTLPKP